MRTSKMLYSGSYDAPLDFTVRSGDSLYLFARDFDEDVDEQIQKSRLKIEEGATHYLGNVPVQDVDFDETKRREFGTGALDRLLTNSLRGLMGAAR